MDIGSQQTWLQKLEIQRIENLKMQRVGYAESTLPVQKDGSSAEEANEDQQPVKLCLEIRLPTCCMLHASSSPPEFPVLSSFGFSSSLVVGWCSVHAGMRDVDIHKVTCRDMYMELDLSLMPAGVLGYRVLRTPMMLKRSLLSLSFGVTVRIHVPYSKAHLVLCLLSVYLLASLVPALFFVDLRFVC